MGGQFDKETSIKNFEWHRERVLREKKRPVAETKNRLEFNLKAVEKTHGSQAARELMREYNSKGKSGKKLYFT
jgi:hypothetical protein